MRKMQEIIKVKDNRPKKEEGAGTTNSEAHERCLKTIDTGWKFVIKPFREKACK
jgi:hypothetical protein